MAEIKDLIQLAVEKKPLDFKETFESIFAERFLSKMDELRVNIAESIYGNPEDEDYLPEDEDLDEDLTLEDEGE